MEQYTTKNAEINDYLRRNIQLPSRPTHLSVNCDSSLLCVVVDKGGCPTAIIYDIPSFAKQVSVFCNCKQRLVDICFL